MTDTDYSNEILNIINALLGSFQEKLTSGQNIKTLNNQSLLGSGNITITGAGTVDSALDTTSTNPVENQVVANALNSKADASLSPTRVYNCSTFSSYINTSASNVLSLYQLGSLYLLRYFISTNSLTYATTEYNMNSDTIPSSYRPASDRTFHVATSSSHNAKIIITSDGKVKISTDTNSTAISLSGTVIYWW